LLTHTWQHRTGCVVGVIRKLYGWDTAAAIAEYESFANPKPRETDVNYLTHVDPSMLLTHPPPTATPRRRGNIPVVMVLTFLGLLVWILTIHQLYDGGRRV
jgi:tyrosine-protein phosphatase SIW14